MYLKLSTSAKIYKRPVLDRFKPVKTETGLKTGLDRKVRSKAVQSGLLGPQNIYRPVSVSVFPKMGQKPDRTGLQNTNDIEQWVKNGLTC